MKKVLFVIVVILSTAVHTIAEDQVSIKYNCTGPWTLINWYGWSVRSSEGVILPLDYNTITIGCAKKPITLQPEHAGTTVVIYCQQPKIEPQAPTVSKIIFVCK